MLITATEIYRNPALNDKDPFYSWVLLSAPEVELSGQEAAVESFELLRQK